jgi:glycogen phosphorylase
MFSVQVFLTGINRAFVRVELYADGSDGGAPVVKKMTRGTKLKAAVKGYLYRVTVTASRPASDYTPGVIPNVPGVSIPPETARILWHH